MYQNVQRNVIQKAAQMRQIKKAQKEAIHEILKALGYTAAGAALGAGGGAGLAALSKEDKKNYVRNMLWGSLLGGLGGLGTYGAVNYAYPWLTGTAIPAAKGWAGARGADIAGWAAQHPKWTEALKALGYTGAGAGLGAGGAALAGASPWLGAAAGGLGGLGAYGAVNYAYPWLANKAMPAVEDWLAARVGDVSTWAAQHPNWAEALKALGYTGAGAGLGAGGAALAGYNPWIGAGVGGLGGLGAYGTVNYAYPWMKDVAYPWIKQKLGYGPPLPRPEITRRDVFPLEGLGPYSANPIMNTLYQSAEQALTPPGP